MKINVGLQGQCPPPTTFEGAPAKVFPPLAQLKRAVMSCLLWEDGFYEDGLAIADRIKFLVPQCQPFEVAQLAVEARTQHRLRHVPLLLVRELARFPSRCPEHLIRDTLYNVIQRADEITEFMAIYWEHGRTPIAKQVKIGLAQAFSRFDEYQLAKYDRKDAPIRLRDVMFMVHARPLNNFGNEVITVSPVNRPKYKRGEVIRDPGSLLTKLATQSLKTPDTWETQLSAGADKKATFERLITEKKLGYMALLRNLRNMRQAEVNRELVINALVEGAAKAKALPFRYVAAHRACGDWVDAALNHAMMTTFQALPKMPGKTVVLVDVSGSMDVPLSKKSDLTRIDAGAALAVLVAGVGQSVAMLTFSNNVIQLDPTRGREGSVGPLELVEMINLSQPHSGTYLGAAVKKVLYSFPDLDRLIVVTDEQSHDALPKLPKSCTGYMINVAQYQHGVGYDDWVRIDGWSEAVVSYIQAFEAGFVTK